MPPPAMKSRSSLPMAAQVAGTVPAHWPDEKAGITRSSAASVSGVKQSRADSITSLSAFSSGQWAGTVPATWAAIGSDDLLFMAGGGILAHPDGAAAGVASIRQAWSAVRNGIALEDAARGAPELARALAFFGKP